MSADHLQWDQYALTDDHIRTLTTHKDYRELFGRVAQGTTPVMALKTRSGHIQIRIKGDGMLHTGSTPSDKRAVKNLESDIRRNMRQIDHNFPKKGEKWPPENTEPE
jgi:hypothetical protein